MARKARFSQAPVWFWPQILLLSGFGMTCFGQAAITNGLLGRWSGDGNAKDSAGHLDGQVTGRVRYVPGPAGQAFQFDGNGSQVDFGPTAGNFGARDFTIAYWMKTTWPPPCAFLGKRGVCNLGNWWEIRGNPPTPGIELLEMDDGTLDGYVRFFTVTPVNDGGWHHLAWERLTTSSGSIMYLVYVDGMLNSTTNHSSVTDVQNTTPLVLGRSICQGSDGTSPYIGAVAELQLFSHALSEEEILALYKAGKRGK